MPSIIYKYSIVSLLFIATNFAHAAGTPVITKQNKCNVIISGASLKIGEKLKWVPLAKAEKDSELNNATGEANSVVSDTPEEIFLVVTKAKKKSAIAKVEGIKNCSNLNLIDGTLSLLEEPNESLDADSSTEQTSEAANATTKETASVVPKGKNKLGLEIAVWGGWGWLTSDSFKDAGKLSGPYAGIIMNPSLLIAKNLKLGGSFGVNYSTYSFSKENAGLTMNAKLTLIEILTGVKIISEKCGEAKVRCLLGATVGYTLKPKQDITMEFPKIMAEATGISKVVDSSYADSSLSYGLQAGVGFNLSPKHNFDINGFYMMGSFNKSSAKNSITYYGATLKYGFVLW